MNHFGLIFLSLSLVAVFYHAYSGIGDTQERHDVLKDKVTAMESALMTVTNQNKDLVKHLTANKEEILTNEEKIKTQVNLVELASAKVETKIQAEDDIINQLRKEIEALSKRVGSCEASVKALKSSPLTATASVTMSLNDEQVPPSMRMYGAAPPNKISEVKREVKVKTIYDGENDAEHLGGSTQNDTMGQSPSLWTFLLKDINVRSIIDVGKFVCITFVAFTRNHSRMWSWHIYEM